MNTSRGLEYGIATSDVLEVSDDLVKDLKSPLKEVVRLATPEDMDKVRELEEKSAQALGAFKEIALESNKDMHPVLVEYLFEGDKAVFYFEAEERIDFRELVRKLASYFHVRVDMRQIGVRDGARIIGGLGHCGQELCCTRFGGEDVYKRQVLVDVAEGLPQGKALDMMHMRSVEKFTVCLLYTSRCV